MNTLTYIHKQSRKRKLVKNKTGKNIPWYKISRDGKCPDQDNSGSINKVYWNHFGCLERDNIEEKENRGKNAEQCAIERMADMKELITRGDTIDIKHIHPIKLAYDLGKECLRPTSRYALFTNKFKTYYKDLIKGHPEIHNLFQSHFATTNEYPLNTNHTKSNPFITTKNNTKQTSNTNKTKKNNKNKTNIITHIP